MTDITIEDEIEWLKSKLKQIKNDFSIPLLESIKEQLRLEEKIEKLRKANYE